MEDTGHTYSQTHALSGPMLRLDMETEARSLFEEARLQGDGRAAKTLVKEGPLRITLLAFTSGAYIDKHHTQGAVAIQCSSGSVRVSSAAESVLLQSSGIVTVQPNLPHSVVAIEDSVLVLFVAMP